MDFLKQGENNIECGNTRLTAFGMSYFLHYYLMPLSIIDSHSVTDHLLTDDMQVRTSASFNKIHKLLQSILFSISELKYWPTANVLKLRTKRKHCMFFYRALFSNVLFFHY